jgi:hypothetical protein
MNEPGSISRELITHQTFIASDIQHFTSRALRENEFQASQTIKDVAGKVLLPYIFFFRLQRASGDGYAQRRYRRAAAAS